MSKIPATRPNTLSKKRWVRTAGLARQLRQRLAGRDAQTAQAWRHPTGMGHQAYQGQREERHIWPIRFGTQIDAAKVVGQGEHGLAKRLHQVWRNSADGIEAGVVADPGLFIFDLDSGEASRLEGFEIGVTIRALGRVLPGAGPQAQWKAPSSLLPARHRRARSAAGLAAHYPGGRQSTTPRPYPALRPDTL